MRWLHVLSGVMWIGLLWYFNFVQIPSMPKIPDEHKPAIGKVIAPPRCSGSAGRARDRGYWRIARLDDGLLGAGIDATNSICRDRYRHVALIMAFNVWFIIWPNQKKALGIVQVAPEEKTKAARWRC